ncbi:hypothetical protein [Paenibacillus gansuensis]|uniref:Uncharacterized protein n=1 Tax=Paenibacillus gansuensis TaxID=306542 RepID=A0ABW5PFR8_9BACL
MEFITFYIFSLMEHTSLFVFMLTFFRFNTRDYIRDLILAGAVISFLSYVNRSLPEVSSFDFYIQLVVTLIFLLIILRIQLFSAILMLLLGMGAIIIIQLLLTYAYITAGITLTAENNTSIQTISIQVLSCIILLGGSYFMHRRGWGVTYIGDDSRKKIKLHKINKSLLILFAVFILSGGLAFYFWMADMLEYQAIPASIFMISIIRIVYLAIKKEFDK